MFALLCSALLLVYPLCFVGSWQLDFEGVMVSSSQIHSRSSIEPLTNGLRAPIRGV